MGIKSKFYFSLFTIIPLVFLIFFTYQVHYIYNKAKKQIARRELLLTQAQASSLSTPLKRGNKEDIYKNLESLNNDPDFIQALVYDKSNKLLYQYPENVTDIHQHIDEVEAPIVYDKNNNLGVLKVHFSLAYLDWQFQKQLIMGTIQFVALLLALYLIISFLLRRLVLNPINHLMDVIQNMSAGDLSARTNIQSKDEMQHIGQAFNQMAQSIQEYSQGLEQKVKERTQELQDSLDEVKKMQKQMVVQEKLASLGSLAAGIAHEIKNPLNFINNLGQLSLRIATKLTTIFETEKTRLSNESNVTLEKNLKNLNENVTKITEYGKRADGIVTGMLEHSRGRTGTFQLKELNPILIEAVKLALHTIQSKDPSFNAEIVYNLDPLIKELEIVPQDLSRVFLNICNNAFYAIYQRKKSEGEAFQPKLIVTTTNLDDSIQISFKDNGPGMSPEVLKKIFAPFFTTKPLGEGTGLGLSISYDIIVQTHSGKLEAQSEPKVYTEFLITLPKKKK